MKLILKKKYVELGDVVSFVFKCTEPVTWIAGQYINITMPDVPPVTADRLFTIASAPFEKDMLITTFIGSSAYKQRMNLLTIDEEVEADQIGGDFFWQEDGRQKLYLAGGIGVTTFRSIILDRFHNNLPNNALMLYAGKEGRRPFVENLRQIEKLDSSLIIKDYDTVKLTLTQLLKDVPDVMQRTAYLAGSQQFSEALGEGLIEKGIPRDQIKYDYFDGYVDIEY